MIKCVFVMLLLLAYNSQGAIRIKKLPSYVTTVSTTRVEEAVNNEKKITSDTKNNFLSRLARKIEVGRSLINKYRPYHGFEKKGKHRYGIVSFLFAIGALCAIFGIAGVVATTILSFGTAGGGAAAITRFFIGAVVLDILSLVFGVIGVVKDERQGLATAGLVIGGLVALVLLITVL